MIVAHGTLVDTNVLLDVLTGDRTSNLPDFFIGSHAAVTGLTLLTRDDTRYRTYFPGVQLLAPSR